MIFMHEIKQKTPVACLESVSITLQFISLQISTVQYYFLKTKTINKTPTTMAEFTTVTL